MVVLHARLQPGQEPVQSLLHGRLALAQHLSDLAE